MILKILHTADWHLGQRLMNRHRQEEQELALSWLVEVIKVNEVDALIVAGDIFDTPNPPNYAEQLYFDFLRKIVKTPCRHIFFIGGNHDAPTKLNAPKALLKIFNIHVLGAISADINDQIIDMKDEKGNLEAIIALVPFLRDRDLLFAVEGESSIDQSLRLKQAIAGHFDTLANKMTAYDENIPIIVTGHLFATGASASGKQDNIYVGNIENIDAGQFSDKFDYVALGHIHRAQSIGNKAHIRYSGSLIPLSFSEVNDVKSITIVNFENGKFAGHEKIPIPTYRKLFQIKGDLSSIELQLNTELKGEDFSLKPWIEIEIEQQDIHSLIDTEIRQLVLKLGGEVLRLKVKREDLERGQYSKVNINLQDVDDLEVFEQKCQLLGVKKSGMKVLKNDYISLKEWMLERRKED